jgi:hypothetical protein
MISLNGRTFNSRRLLLGALLGVVALGAVPGKASAQIPPLDAINTVGNILGIGQQPPRERPNTDVLNGNMNNNSFDFCVLTCDLPSQLLPTGGRPVPPQARPPIPPQARPIPPQGRPVAPPQAARRPQGPTILLPPIQL